MTIIAATFIVGLVFGWCFCIALDPRSRKAHNHAGNPPICQHCGCAHPLGDQNPASDPGLRT